MAQNRSNQYPLRIDHRWKNHHNHLPARHTTRGVHDAYAFNAGMNNGFRYVSNAQPTEVHQDMPHLEYTRTQDPFLHQICTESPPMHQSLHQTRSDAPQMHQVLHQTRSDAKPMQRRQSGKSRARVKKSRYDFSDGDDENEYENIASVKKVAEARLRDLIYNRNSGNDFNLYDSKNEYFNPTDRKTKRKSSVAPDLAVMPGYDFTEDSAQISLLNDSAGSNISSPAESPRRRKKSHGNNWLQSRTSFAESPRRLRSVSVLDKNISANPQVPQERTSNFSRKFSNLDATKSANFPKSALLEKSTSVSTTSKTVSGVLKKRKKVVLLGLDGAGKTTLLMRLKCGSFVTTAPTVGFNHVKVWGGGYRWAVWDVGGGERIRPLWATYTRGAGGLIYVVDAAASDDCMEEARLELHRILKVTKAVAVQTKKPQPPLLVMANFQDRLAARNGTEVVEALQLEGPASEGLSWTVALVSGASGEGLHVAMASLRALMDRGPTAVKGPVWGHRRGA